MESHDHINNYQGQLSEIAVGECELQACQSCRRRKLRCSREAPICSQCSRLSCECIYDRKRQKPGIKSGAVEGLSRRLELLENILLDQNGFPKSLVEEKNLQQYIIDRPSSPDKHRGPKCCIRTNHDYNSCTDPGGEPLYHTESHHQEPPQKRRRTDGRYDMLEQDWDYSEGEALSESLPSTQAMAVILRTFSEVLHPWIPFIHLGQLDGFIKDPNGDHIDSVILHAIVFASIHHCKNEEVGMTEMEKSNQASRSKNMVMLTATNWLALENIQALVIIAFHHMGSGNFSKAWPIIGSLTRTVQYLQLTVESDHGEQHCLLEPLNLLERSRSWTESENRRRILWNVFLLDRFCSVTTGWNTSLTSDDVHCKLPCDGGHWHREEPVTTPFFGIWDKTAAKIGNSVAYIPSYYPSPDVENQHPSPRGIFGSGTIDVSKLGAFAYCIEATESLSQVTSFFLQQKVDFADRGEVNSWLTRFKELDLRLVHWKMFLPQKWKDSNISRDGGTVNMDPNLTLAHITHNTSMILLHQHIAHPPSAWSDLVKLPSACSAETCRLAAVETASITQKYLRYTPAGILNHQFSFCVFVAARLLLAHTRAFNGEFPSQYHTLLQNLNEISTRWNGNSVTKEGSSSKNVANLYAKQLQHLGQKCNDSTQKSVDAILNSSACPDPSSLEKRKAKPRSSKHATMKNQQSIDREITKEPLLGTGVQHIISSQHRGSENSCHEHSQPQLNTQYSQARNRVEMETESLDIAAQLLEYQHDRPYVRDELTEMSDILLGQQFLELDRVITLNGTDFSLDFEAWE